MLTLHYHDIKEEETGLWTTLLCWPCRGSAGPALSCCVGVSPPSHSPWRAPLSLALATAHPFLASTSAHQFLIPSSGAYFKEVPDEALAGSLLLVRNVVPFAPFRGFWRLLLICHFSCAQCCLAPGEAVHRPGPVEPPPRQSWVLSLLPFLPPVGVFCIFFPAARPNKRVFCSSAVSASGSNAHCNLNKPSLAIKVLQQQLSRWERWAVATEESTSDIKASDPNPHLWGCYKGININDFLSLLFVQPAKFMKSLLYTLAAQSPKLPPLIWTEHLKT